MWYGEHFISYNVHCLIHLPKFVKTHGSFYNFSCFWYENYLQKIKNCLKSTKILSSRNPQQLIYPNNTRLLKSTPRLLKWSTIDILHFIV